MSSLVLDIRWRLPGRVYSSSELVEEKPWQSSSSLSPSSSWLLAELDSDNGAGSVWDGPYVRVSGVVHATYVGDGPQLLPVLVDDVEAFPLRVHSELVSQALLFA